MAYDPTQVATLDAVAQATGAKETQLIVNMMTQTNEILWDALWRQANSKNSHRTTVRTGLPEPTWVKLYRGPQPSRGALVEIEDTAGMMEAMSEVDVRILKREANPARFRLLEAEAHIQAMGQTLAKYIIYGSEVDEPASFTGLAPRYSDKSAATGANIIDGGSTSPTGNTSIWMVTWSQTTTHMFYPENTKAGIERESDDREPRQDPNGGTYYVATDLFRMQPGLSVRDWRWNVRIANIDLNSLSTVNILDLLRRAVYKLPAAPRTVNNTPKTDDSMVRANPGKTVIYCNAEIMEALDKEVDNKSNVLLRLSEVDGVPLLSYRGIPIRRVDAISTNEGLVT